MAEYKWPKFDLAKSIEVARVVAKEGGGTVTLSQLAALLNYGGGTTSGTFVNRVGAARRFGLVEGRSAVTPTELAGKILDPVYPDDAAKGRLQAFLSVPLYKAVFERFEGKSLPTAKGFENALCSEFGIPEKNAARVRSGFMRSAQQAGLFDVAGDQNKMIQPLTGKGSASNGEHPDPPPPPPPPPGDEAENVIPKVVLGTLETIPWDQRLDDDQIEQVAEVIKSNMRLHFMFKNKREGAK